MSRSSICLLCALASAYAFSAPMPPMWVSNLDSNDDADYTLVDLRVNFDLFDVDKNGHLTPDEFAAFCGIAFGVAENGLSQSDVTDVCSNIHKAVQKNAGSAHISLEGWIKAFLSCPAGTVQPFIAGIRKELADMRAEV